MEEERRLCYVAITRAKERLTISYARQRMLYGRTNAALPSRFLKELPEDSIVKKGSFRAERPEAARYPRYGGWDNGSIGYQPSAKQILTTRTEPAKTPMLELAKGDMIQHTAFGRGLVLSLMKMSGDALLEIAFDQIGTKKLMAKSASPHMKKL